MALLLVSRATAQTLTVKTTSTDTDKQCVAGDQTKTKTGETELTLHLNYQLTAAFATASSSITIELPMRYQDYFEGNTGSGSENLVAASTYESMVDSSILTVKMIHQGSGTTYWPTTVALTDSLSLFSPTSGADSRIVATFGATPVATINSGEFIDIYVTGVKNPASTLIQNNFKLSLFNASTSTTDSSTSVTGLETCVKDSEQASASALVGYDRVGTTSAVYQFRFKSQNVYPAKAGFKVTLPTTLVNTNMADYSLTCNTGCTASSAVTPTNSPTTELFFEDVFTAEVAAGTIIDLTIAGWTNPETETALVLTFEVLWNTSNDYQIDKFSNLGALPGSKSIFTNEFANTAILITDLAKRGTIDCRIREPYSRYIEPQAPQSSATVTTHVIEGSAGTSGEKFEAIGVDCSGRNSFKISAHARFVDGTRLSPKYAIAQFNSDGLIEVKLTPARETRSYGASAESHAVYVQVTDGTNLAATNTFCFMVTVDSSENFCKSICQEQAFMPVSVARVEYLEYFIKSSGTSDTVTYTDEFTMISQNPVMCPVLYAQGTSTDSHSQVDSSGNAERAVNAYNPSTGSFYVQTDVVACALANAQGSESYSFAAYTDAFSKTMPFTVYFESCQDATVLAVKDFSIIVYLLDIPSPDQDFQTYTDQAIGFESSDETNCPLATEISPTYTFCTDDSVCSTGATSLANYWSTDSNSLKLQRENNDSLTGTFVSTPQTVYVKATFGSLEVTNTITVTIEDCSNDAAAVTWNCNSCKNTITFNPALSADVTTAINERTIGCSDCVSTKFLEYTLETGSTTKLVRQCSDVLQVAKANTPCDLGMLYDASYECTVTCSSVLTGCALCSSHTVCQLCTDPLHTIETYTDEWGTTWSVCQTEVNQSTNICLDCSITCDDANCDLCSSLNSAQCKSCKSGFYLSGGACVAITAGTTTVNLHVKPSGKVSYTPAELSAINSATGSDSDQFYFIQQVFHTVYSDPSYASLEAVTVNVALESGNHFLFSCHNDLYADYIYDDSTSSFTDLCAEVPSLQQLNPPTDNISFVFTGNSLTTIHVLDPYYHFNITRSMSFESVTFRGESALAQHFSSSITPTYPPLATIPVIKCTNTKVDRCSALVGYSCGSSYTADTYGSHKTLEFAVSSSISPLDNTLITCSDTGFQSASQATAAIEACTNTADSTTVESVRACGGEPYDSDFFNFDSVSGLPYKRHKVLFNLYNWDLQSSYQDSTTSTLYASLTLTNCKFYYFLAGYDALIHVQTNNIAVIEPRTPDEKTHIIELSDNRGANIVIQGSKFESSRFCKGMIVYKRRPVLESTDSVQILRMADFIEEPTELSQLIIEDSTLYNLNQGKVLSTISLLNNATMPIADLTSMQYPTFDNHGAVLNLQGYPGYIRVTGSTIENNLVYIPDIFPSKRSPLDEKEQLLNFVNSETGQIATTRCNSTQATKRFFSDYLDSLSEIESHKLSQLEKHSPIYISYPRNPVVFDSNTFESNIGLLGGAISIDSPNFVDDANDDRVKNPYILLSNNLFNLTQAYVSGNAIYVRSTRERGSTNETVEACAGGLTIFNNDFEDTMPIIHGSNGGAVSIECDFVALTNSTKLGASNQIVSGPFQQVMFSQYDASGSPQMHKGYRFAAALVNNTFARTSTGQKGSAIYARQVSYLLAQNNTFIETRPTMAIYLESQNAPYRRLLAIDTSTSPATAKGRIFYYNSDLNSDMNEWEYLRLYATAYEDGGLIPMSQHQGAIYLESCQSCLVSFEFGGDARDSCSFCHSLLHEARIHNNTFVNNDAGVAFFEAETMRRSVLLQARGGSNYTISSNEISFTASGYYSSANIVLQNYYKSLPSNFFSSLQAPLMRLDIPNADQVHFWNNTVSDIEHVQPLFSHLSYNASLLQVDSASNQTNLTVVGNQVDNMIVYGGKASLIYADGATVMAKDNRFTRVGSLNTAVKNFTLDIGLTVKATYMPVVHDDWSSRNWTQGRGVFQLRSGVRSASMITPQEHVFKNNTFRFVFCQDGCIVSQVVPDLAMPSYMEFESNSYEHVFSLKGALLHAAMDTQSDSNTYAIYNFTSEYIYQVQNGAILVEGQDHRASILMQDVEVTNYQSGYDLAVVELSQGHLFLCKQCRFMNTIKTAFLDTMANLLTEYDVLNFDITTTAPGMPASVLEEIEKRATAQYAEWKIYANETEKAASLEKLAQFIYNETFKNETLRTIEEIWNRSDANGDGKLVYEEFYVFMVLMRETERLNGEWQEADPRIAETYTIFNQLSFGDGFRRLDMLSTWAPWRGKVLSLIASDAALYTHLNATQPYMSAFNSTGNRKGVIHLDSVSAEAHITDATKIEDILVGGVEFGFRLAQEYQFISYESQEWGDKLFGSEYFKWQASSFQYAEYQQWKLGNPDFLPYSLITNSTFNNLQGADAVVSVNDAKLEVRTTTFTENYMEHSGASILKASATFLLLGEDVSFRDNIADMGGAISLRLGSHLDAMFGGTVFQGNQALSNGGVLHMNQAGSASLSNCQIKGNLAVNQGSVIYASNGQHQTQIKIIHTTVEENHAEGQGLFVLEGVQLLDVENTIMLKNTARQVSNGFISNDMSKVTITNSLIKNIEDGQQQANDERALRLLSREQMLPDEQSWMGRSRQLVSKQLSYRDDSDFKEAALGRAMQATSVGDTTSTIAGFFYLSGQSSLTMRDSEVQGTVGKLASVVYATSGSSVELDTVRLNDLAGPSGCQFEKSGVIVGVQASSIAIHNSNFTANGCSYVWSDRTPVAISNSRFAQGSSSPYVSMRGSVLSISDSIFSKTEYNQVALGNGVHCDACEQVVVKSSTFEGLQSNKGGAIYLKDTKQTYFEENQFLQNTGRLGGAIYIQNSVTLLKGNTFKENKAEPAITLKQIQEQIEQKMDELDSQKALEAASAEQVAADEIESIDEEREKLEQDATQNELSYQRNEGKGGAVFFTCIDPDMPLGQYVVTLPDFCEETKPQDGKPASAEHLDCIEKQDKSGDDVEGADIAASEEVAHCELSIQDNKWVNNTAYGENFDIYWTNKNLTDIIEPQQGCLADETQFSESVCIKNPVAFSRISVLPSNNSHTKEDADYMEKAQALFESMPELNEKLNINQVKGGVIFRSGTIIGDLMVSLFAENGEHYRAPANSIANLQPIDATLPKNSESKVRRMSTNSKGEEAEYIFGGNNIILKPDTTILVKLDIPDVIFSQAGQNDPDNVDKTTIFWDGNGRPDIYVFHSRACAQGEQYTTDFQCKDCPPKTYSFIPHVEPNECPPCPDYGICKDGYLFPQKGYMRMHEETDVFIACFNPEACLEGKVSSPLSVCAEGYTGIMCASCAANHWKPFGTYLCHACSNETLSLLKFYACPVFAFLFILMLNNQFLRQFPIKNQETVAIIRIFINMYQTLFILSVAADSASMDGTNKVLKYYIDNKLSILSLINWIVDFQCMHQHLGLDQVSLFYSTLLAYALLPLVLLAAITFIWTIYMGIIACMYRDNNAFRFECKKLVGRVAMTFGISMFPIYSHICCFLLQATSCFKSLADDSDKDMFVYRLRMSPDVLCSDSRYIVHLAAVILPGILLYVVVIPFLAICRMNCHAKTIYLSGQLQQSEQEVPQRGKINEVKSEFGFFFSGLNLGSEKFELEKDGGDEDGAAGSNTAPGGGEKQLTLAKKLQACFGQITRPIQGGVIVNVKDDKNRDEAYVKSFYYWEFIQHVQKTVLQIMVVYMVELNQGLQANVLFLAISVFAAIQYFNSPYYKQSLNRLNLAAMGALTLFSFSRVLIRSSQLGTTNASQDSDEAEIDLIGSYTGQKLSNEFKAITRASVFQDDTATVEIVVLIPVIIVFTVVDLLFVWAFIMQFLKYLLQSQRDGLFRCLTCNIWKIQEFRINHMPDILDRVDSGEENDEVKIDPTLIVKRMKQQGVVDHNDIDVQTRKEAKKEKKQQPDELDLEQLCDELLQPKSHTPAQNKQRRQGRNDDQSNQKGQAPVDHEEAKKKEEEEKTAQRLNERSAHDVSHGDQSLKANKNRVTPADLIKQQNANKNGDGQGAASPNHASKQERKSKQHRSGGERINTHRNLLATPESKESGDDGPQQIGRPTAKQDSDGASSIEDDEEANNLGKNNSNKAARKLFASPDNRELEDKKRPQTALLNANAASNNKSDQLLSGDARENPVSSARRTSRSKPRQDRASSRNRDAQSGANQPVEDGGRKKRRKQIVVVDEESKRSQSRDRHATGDRTGERKKSKKPKNIFKRKSSAQPSGS